MRIKGNEAIQLQKRLFYNQSSEKFDDIMESGKGYDEFLGEVLAEVREATKEENNHEKPDSWYSYPTDSTKTRRASFVAWLARHLIDSECDFAEKMTHFWLNHFVVEYEGAEGVGNERVLMSYYLMARGHSMGDFKEFVRSVAKAAGMLIYLNGDVSGKEGPSENFPRELMELFTLGEGNGYDEEEVAVAAKAFTGYRYRFNEELDDYECYIDEDQHDFSEKTFMGVTGNLNGDDIIDILFEKRREEISLFISEKLLAWFGCSGETSEEAKRIAKMFEGSDFNIEVLCNEVLKSQYVRYGIRDQIKDPMQVLGEAIHSNDGLYPHQTYGLSYTHLVNAGHAPFNYPDVSGHKTNDYWVNGPDYLERLIMLAPYVKNGADENMLTPEYHIFKKNGGINR